MRSWYYSLFYADQNLLWSKDSMGDLLERLEYITEIQEGTVEKLNPSQLRWAPPIHEAMGGHGFSTVPPCSTPNIETSFRGCLFLLVAERV